MRSEQPSPGPARGARRLDPGADQVAGRDRVRRARRFSERRQGDRRFASLFLADGGPGNHHQYMTLARQGLCWWEIDVTYYFLSILSSLRIVWDLRRPYEWKGCGLAR